MSGRILVLNGTPRAGKSSLARAVQEDVPGSWLVLGVDSQIAILPEALKPGIGLRPGGERPDLEVHVVSLYQVLFDSIATYAEAGYDVVSDLGIHDVYSRPLGIWPMLEERLAGLDLVRIGVTCPIDVIMARRNASPQGHYLAGPGVPEPVHRWQEAVHTGKTYDLTIDTAQLSARAGAEAIGRYLADRAGSKPDR